MLLNNSAYKTVSGVLSSEHKIEELLEALNNGGVNRDQIDIIMSDKTRDQYTSLSKENKAPEGASLGGVSGGILGGIIGGLTMAGSLLIPGVNLLVSGPIIGALAGTAAGAAAGGFVGALVGLGIPEFEAKAYQKELEAEGNVLVVAHVVSENVPEVQKCFKQYGAKETLVQMDTPTEATSGLLR